MANSEIASVVKLIESIDSMIKIAEKNPVAFSIDALRKSREAAVRQLEESKNRYRNAMHIEAAIDDKASAGSLNSYKR